MGLPRPCLALLVAIVLVAINYGSACQYINEGARWRRSTAAVLSPDGDTIFRLCDGDQNSLISLKEMRRCLFLPYNTARNEMIRMDIDGNGELSLNEMKGHIRFDTSDAATCYQVALMKCGMRFMMYSRTRKSNENSLCGALQEYVDCVGEDTTCDLGIMVSFKRDLIDMVASGESDSICPNVNTDSLGKVGEYTTLSCSKLALVECDMMLLIDLHDGIEPCKSLTAYEQCIKESTENCKDDAARYARAGSHGLVVAYLGNRICAWPKPDINGDNALPWFF